MLTDVTHGLEVTFETEKFLDRRFRHFRKLRARSTLVSTDCIKDVKTSVNFFMQISSVLTSRAVAWHTIQMRRRREGHEGAVARAR